MRKILLPSPKLLLFSFLVPCHRTYGHRADLARFGVYRRATRNRPTVIGTTQVELTPFFRPSYSTKVGSDNRTENIFHPSAEYILGIFKYEILNLLYKKIKLNKIKNYKISIYLVSSNYLNVCKFFNVNSLYNYFTQVRNNKLKL